MEVDAGDEADQDDPVLEGAVEVDELSLRHPVALSDELEVVLDPYCSATLADQGSSYQIGIVIRRERKTLGELTDGSWFRTIRSSSRR